jgi:hypothetical protein
MMMKILIIAKKNIIATWTTNARWSTKCGMKNITISKRSAKLCKNLVKRLQKLLWRMCKCMSRPQRIRGLIGRIFIHRTRRKRMPSGKECR